MFLAASDARSTAAAATSSAVFGRFSIFYIDNDPTFVRAMFGLTVLALFAMTLGVRTRVTTIVVTSVFAMTVATGDTWALRM